MACTGTIHQTLRTPQANLVAEVEAALNATEISGYPVFLTFDDWNFPPPGWAADPTITEWTDWSGTLLVGPKLDAVFGAIGGRARTWESQGRGYLFADIAP